MNVDELSEVEREALVAAVYLLVNADGRIDASERREIDALADELGDPALSDRIRDAGDTVRGLDDLTARVRRVERPNAREMIRTVLFDLANADGARDAAENGVLDLITREWARH